MYNLLTGSEALYGFNAWLTTRDKATKLGAKYECASICDLIQKFCKVNNLTEPRNNYTDYLTMPEDK